MKQHMCVHTKFGVSTKILTSIRHGDNPLPSPNPPQNEPLKTHSRLGLRKELAKYF